MFHPNLLLRNLNGYLPIPSVLVVSSSRYLVSTTFLFTKIFHQSCCMSLPMITLYSLGAKSFSSMLREHAFHLFGHIFCKIIGKKYKNSQPKCYLCYPNSENQARGNVWKRMKVLMMCMMLGEEKRRKS